MPRWIRSGLVQIMVCRLFGVEPLSKPLLGHCCLHTKNKLWWNFNQNTKLFIHENSSTKMRLRNYVHFVQGEMSWFCCCAVACGIIQVQFKMYGVIESYLELARYSSIGKYHDNQDWLTVVVWDWSRSIWRLVMYTKKYLVMLNTWEIILSWQVNWKNVFHGWSCWETIRYWH